MRHVTIIGTGYVGLVSGACFAELGNQVTCLDVDTERIRSLRAGVVPFFEPGLQELGQSNPVSGRLRFSSPYSEGVARAVLVFL